jgi:DeoR/GlpR family transcriptional regulator of sugar metabolism
MLIFSYIFMKKAVILRKDKESRKNLILDTLNQKKRIKTGDLLEILDVSPITLRKDLKELELEGLITRQYGFISLSDSILDVNSYMNRLEKNKDKKEKIAFKALEQLGNAKSIAVGSGTSCYYFASKMPPNVQLSIVTTGIFVAMELLKKPRSEVFIAGGKIFKPDLFVSGKISEDFLSDLYFDIAFFSSAGVVPGEGFFEEKFEYSYMRNNILERSEKIYFLIDSTKIGQHFFYNLYSFGENVTVITDSGIDEEQVKRFKDTGSNLIIA